MTAKICCMFYIKPSRTGVVNFWYFIARYNPKRVASSDVKIKLNAESKFNSKWYSSKIRCSMKNNTNKPQQTILINCPYMSSKYPVS